MERESRDQRLLEAIRVMAAITGVELREPWQQKTVPIVALVLDYTRPLRKFNLGDIEPATTFTAR